MSRHFIKTSDTGFVFGYSFSDFSPDPEWQEVQEDAAYTLRGTNKYRFVDGQLIESDQPQMPPQPWSVWQGDQWIDPRTPETQWVVVRSQRDELLAESDWVAIRAVDRGEPVPQDWAVYRQALRDITVQPDPFSITWPTPPA
jgi:hypothetical protein